MAARFLVSSRFQGQFVVRLREGLGVQMHPKSWHCQKRGGRGSATFQDFLEDLYANSSNFHQNYPTRLIRPWK